MDDVIAMDRKARRKLYKGAFNRISEDMDVLAKCGDAFHKLTLWSVDKSEVEELKKKLAQAEANYKTVKGLNKELSEKLSLTDESNKLLIEDAKPEKAEKEAAYDTLMRGRAKLLERAEAERFKTAAHFLDTDSFRNITVFGIDMARKEAFKLGQKEIEKLEGRPIPAGFQLDKTVDEEGDLWTDEFPTEEEVAACEFRELVASSRFPDTPKWLPEWIPEVLQAMTLPPTEDNREFNTEMMDIAGRVNGWTYPFSLAEWEEAQSKMKEDKGPEFITGSGRDKE